MVVRSFRFALLGCLSALTAVVSGCDDGSQLFVDLRTDLVAGEEFSGVRVRISEAGGASVSMRDSLATYGEDYTIGRRVLELDGLENGAYVAVVELRDAAGSLVADRRTAFQIEGDFAFTSLISRDARACDVSACGAEETCGPGECVSVMCFPEATSACPPTPDCVMPTDCAPRAACSVPICYGGVCLYATTAGACASDEWCNPDEGCLPGTVMLDGGMPMDGGPGFDGGPRDGGPDAGVVCPPGFAECDGNLADPCELPVSDDVRNCGGCGVRCGTAPNGTPACRASTCTVDCSPGFADCNGVAADGCESNPLLDAMNCGSCGSVCPASLPICVAGDCVRDAFPSTGAEGAFEPTADMVLPAGVHHFTTVTIPAGVTIRTNGNGVLEIRATGDVRIEGTIDVSGGRGGDAIPGDVTAPGGGGNTGTTVAGAMGVTMTCPPDGLGGTGAPGGGGSGTCAAGGRYGGGTGSGNLSGGGGGGHAGGSGGGPAGGAGGTTTGSMGGAGASGAGRGGEPGQGAYSGGNGESFGCCNSHGGGGGSIGLAAIDDLAMTTTFRPGSSGGGGSGISSGGGSSSGGGGGGAGGALRIASATRIVIDGATFLARGGDGGLGDSYSGGGGAGSGGAIYLAAPEMDLMASMSVIGGVGAGNNMGGTGGLGRIRISVVPERCMMGLTSMPPVMTSCTETNMRGYVYIGRYPD